MVGVGSEVCDVEAAVDVVRGISLRHAGRVAGLDGLTQGEELVRVDVRCPGGVGHDGSHAAGCVGSRVEPERDQEAQVLFGGEVTQEGEVFDQSAALLVSKDVVDPGDVTARGATIPVDAGTECGRVLVGEARRHIVPS